MDSGWLNQSQSSYKKNKTYVVVNGKIFREQVLLEMELMITLSPSINIVIIDDINVIKNIMHFLSKKKKKRRRKKEHNAFFLILYFPIFFSCHKRKSWAMHKPMQSYIWWWSRKVHQWDARSLHSVAIACKREQHRNIFKGHRCGAGQTPSEG